MNGFDIVGVMGFGKEEKGGVCEMEFGFERVDLRERSWDMKHVSHC